MKQVIRVKDAVPALPVFSQAVITRPTTGLIYLSGNIGCTNDLVLVEGGVKPQTKAALENIVKILKSVNSSLDDIVKVNIYLSNMPRDFSAMNEVYTEFFGKENLPARTCVGVAALPMSADVEIECVAELPTKSAL